MKQLATKYGFRLSALAVISLFSLAVLLGVGASLAHSYAKSESAAPARQAIGREKQRAQISSAHRARAIAESAHRTGAGSLLSPPPVVSITVDRTDDTPSASLCTAAANDCSLRGAVAFANSVPGTTIIVPAGTYNLNISGGVTSAGSGEGFSGDNSIGDLDVSQSNTSIVGAGAASTIIDQTSSANDRIIEVNPNLDSGFVFSISGVTLRGGRTPDGGGAMISGSFNNSTSVSNCVFDGNQTIDNSSPGGALWNIGGGTLTVSGSTFTGNSSADSAGGAITMDNFGSGDLTVTGSSFTSNTTGAGSSGGGAIAILGTGGTHNISTSSFAGNRATHPSGGGGAIFSSNSGGTLNVRYSRFFNNTAAQPVQGNTLSRSGGSFTANDNWWGVNTGPAANDISGLVTHVSWLQLRIEANPDTICPNGTSTLTADIFGRNAGGPTAAANLAGLPPFAATFSTAPPNTVSPATTQLVNGQATSTFTAVNASGSADADVTADNETETVTIAVNTTSASALTSVSACAGQSASFSTTAGGTAPFTFVWKKGATTLNNGDLGGRVTISTSGNTSTLSISGLQGTDAGSYTVEVTGACDTVSQSATLSIDSTAPTITAPADATYQCASDVPAASASQATAADNCSTPTVTVSETTNGGAGSSSNPLVITRTYTATDDNGNTASDSQTITVADTTAPSVTAPADSSASASASCQTAIPNVVAGSTAADNCGGTVSLSQSPAAGTLVGLGAHTITVTATDAVGNTASDTVVFTVNDTTAPAITAPADAAYQCASSVPASSPAQATASDNCGAPTVTVTESNNGGAGTSSSPLVITRTYTATDGAGNAASDSQTITVIDSTAPSVDAPAPTTAAADANCQAAIPNVVAGSTAADNCGGTVSLSQSPAAGTLVGPGPHTITVTGTDAAGNTGSDTTTFTVTDSTPPTLQLNGSASMTIECHSVFADPGATATDACAGNLTSAIQVSSNVNANAVGNYTVTYTVSDGSNPPVVKTRTVIVVDTTAPVITLNGANPLTISCQLTFTDPGATASDSCAGSGPATASGNVNVNVPGTYTITYTASDAAGNAATPVTRTVIVLDTGAPVINLKTTPISFWPPDHDYRTVNIADMVASVTDACSSGSLGISSVVISKVTSDEAENGNGDGNTLNDIVIASNCKSVQLRSERDGGANGRVYSITLKVTDAAGNVGTATFKVTVSRNYGEAAVDSGPVYTVTSSCP